MPLTVRSDGKEKEESGWRKLRESKRSQEGGREGKKERRNWGEKIAEQRDSSIALLAWGVGGGGVYGGGLIPALSVSVLRHGDLIGRGRRERKGGSLRCRGRLQVSEDVTRQ